MRPWKILSHLKWNQYVGMICERCGGLLTSHQDGLAKVPYDATQSIDMPGQKRKRGHTELEVPDSEDDENYGWGDGDEAAMPAPPPQWQGSEDILLGQEVGRSDEEYSDDGYGDSDGGREGLYESD